MSGGGLVLIASQILGLIAPQWILLVAAMLVLALDLTLGEEREGWLPYIALLGLGAALVASLSLWNRQVALFEGLFLIDRFAVFFQIIAVLATGLVILASIGYFEGKTPYKGQFYALLLVTALAITLLASAADLVMVFISIEVLSVTSYTLTGYLIADRKSTEAGLKFFLYGAAASAIMLYGMTLLYGATGSTNLAEIGRTLSLASGEGSRWLPIAAIVMLLVGFGFKVSAAPFHQWAPDVYEGAPTPFAAFLSVGSKAAGFAILLRVFLTALPDFRVDWFALVTTLSIATMTLGNLIAIFQENIKRMLAYSSIAQAGYILIGLACWDPQATGRESISAILFYLLAYLFTNLGAFTVVIAVERAVGTNEISDYAGLIRRNPWLAAALFVFFLSLVGIPPTGVFVGKLLIFAAAVRLEYYALVIVALINGVISLYYYYGVLRRVFFLAPRDEAPIAVSTPLRVVLAVTLIMTLGTAIFAQPFIRLALTSAAL
jgi:proton-translocating NADH-quinone oxidoreductase chain N